MAFCLNFKPGGMTHVDDGGTPRRQGERNGYQREKSGVWMETHSVAKSERDYGY